MTTYRERVDGLNAARMKAWDAGQEIIQRAIRERRAMTGEEEAAFDRANDEITRLDRKRDELIASEEAQAEIEEANEALRSVFKGSVVDTARERERVAFRDFYQGRAPSLTIDLRRASYVSDNYQAGARGADMFEVRGLYTDAGSGSLVLPSLVSRDVYAVMIRFNAMRRTRMSVLTTNDGNPIAVPTGSQGAATQVATENTVIGGTDPSLATTTLNAFRAGHLVAIANDLVADSSVDMLGWVANSIASTIATKEEEWWVAGTGSNQPRGLMNAGGTGIGGTVATGGSLILGPAGQVIDKLIDVQYSVAGPYRSVGEWICNDSTAGTLRKLRSGAGGTLDNYLWVPSPTAGLVDGTPDTFLGRPIYTTTACASMGSDAKVLAFGDLSRYVAREVQGLQLQRSTDIYFDRDQIAVRGLVRVDGDLVDATAVNILHQAVT